MRNRNAAKKPCPLFGKPISGFENAYPYQLSGGMRKRSTSSDFGPQSNFSLDGKRASLDVFTQEMLQTYILSLWQTTQRTVVFITMT